MNYHRLQLEENERLRAAVVKLRAALKGVIDATQSTKMVTSGSGICGQTVEVNIKASVYLRVPAWPIEEAIGVYYETETI